MATNEGSEINFRLKTPKQDEATDSYFVTDIIGVTDFFSAYGTYNVSGMGLISSQGAELNVNVEVYAIDTRVPDIYDYLSRNLNRTL